MAINYLQDSRDRIANGNSTAVSSFSGSNNTNSLDASRSRNAWSKYISTLQNYQDGNASFGDLDNAFKEVQQYQNYYTADDFATVQNIQSEVTNLKNTNDAFSTYYDAYNNASTNLGNGQYATMSDDYNNVSSAYGNIQQYYGNLTDEQKKFVDDSHTGYENYIDQMLSGWTNNSQEYYSNMSGGDAWAMRGDGYGNYYAPIYNDDGTLAIEGKRSGEADDEYINSRRDYGMNYLAEHQDDFKTNSEVDNMFNTEYEKSYSYQAPDGFYDMYNNADEDTKSYMRNSYINSIYNDAEENGMDYSGVVNAVLNMAEANGTELTDEQRDNMSGIIHRGLTEKDSKVLGSVLSGDALQLALGFINYYDTNESMSSYNKYSPQAYEDFSDNNGYSEQLRHWANDTPDAESDAFASEHLSNMNDIIASAMVMSANGDNAAAQQLLRDNNLDWDTIKNDYSTQVYNRLSGESEDVFNQSEKDMINYLYNTQGADAVIDYMQSVGDVTNSRANQMSQQYARDFATSNAWNGIVSSIETVYQAPIATLLSAKGWIGGKDKDSSLFQIQRDFAATRSSISEKIKSSGGFWGTVGGVAYDAGMSVFDNLYAVGIGTVLSGGTSISLKVLGNSIEAVTLGIMGTSAATSQYQQRLSEGWSKTAASFSGIISGAVEIFTEKVSLDKVFKIAQTAGKVPAKKLIVDVLKAGFTEGTEEINANILDRIADSIIAVADGKGTDYEQKVNEYMAQGMSSADAERKAFGDMISEDGEAFILGAVSGLAMGGGAAVIGNVKTSISEGSEINGTKGKGVTTTSKEATIKTLETARQAFDGDEKALQAIDGAIAKIESGKGVSSYKLGNIVDSVASEIASEYGEMGSDEYNNAYNFAVNTINQVYNSNATTERITAPSTKLTSAIESNSIQDIVDNTNDLGAEFESVTGMSATEENVSKYIQAYNTEYNEGMKPVSAKNIESIVVNENGRTVVRMRDGSFVDSRNIDANETTSALLNEMSNLDVRNANAMYKMFDPEIHGTSTAEVQAYANAFNTIYNQALIDSNITYEEIASNVSNAIDILGNNVAQVAFNQARLQQSVSNKYNESVAKTNAKIKGEYRNLVKQSQMSEKIKSFNAIAQSVAKTIGVNIELTTDIKGNAHYDVKSNTIRISANASNIARALYHELFEFTDVHNTEQATTVMETVNAWYLEKVGAKQYNETLRRYQQTYANEDVEGIKSDRSAMKEMAADALASMFSTEDGATQFASWVNDHADVKEKRHIRRFFEKLFSFFKALVGDTSGMNTLQKTAFTDEASVNDMRQAFLDVLDSTSVKSADVVDDGVRLSVDVTDGKVNARVYGAVAKGLTEMTSAYEAVFQEMKKGRIGEIKYESALSIAKEFARKYSSSADVNWMAKKIQEMARLFNNGKADISTITDISDKIANKITDNSKSITMPSEESIKIADEIYSTEVTLSNEQINALSDEFGMTYDEFVDATKGLIKISKTGKNITSFWNQLQKAHPDVFDATTTKADIPMTMFAIASTISTRYIDGINENVVGFKISGELMMSLAELTTKDLKGSTMLDKINYLNNAVEDLVQANAYYKDIIERMRLRNRETKARQKLNRSINKILSQFNKMLNHPNEKRFVPKNLVQLVYDTCNIIGEQGATAKISDKVAKIVSAYDALASTENGVDIYDSDVASMLNKIALELADYSLPLNKLSVEQITKVNAMLNMVYHMVTNGAKTFYSTQATTIKQLSDNLCDAVENHAKDPTLFGDALYRAMRPREMFERFGGYAKDNAFVKMFDDLDEAAHDQMRYEREGYEIFRSCLDMKNKTIYDNFTKMIDKDVDIGLKDEKGNAIKINRDMMIELYFHLQYKDNIRHLSYGGLQVANMKSYYNNPSGSFSSGVRVLNYGKAFNQLNQELKKAEAKNGGPLSDEQMLEFEQKFDDLRIQRDQELYALRENIESQLTDYDRAWIRAVKDFTEYSQKRIQETTLKMFGFEKPMVNGYYHIEVANNLKGNSTEGTTGYAPQSGALTSMGILQDRVASSLPINLNGVSRTMTKLIKDTARFSALAPVERDFAKARKRIRNGTMDTLDSLLESQFTRSKVDAKTGIDKAKKITFSAVKYLNDLIDDLNGVKTNYDGVGALANKALGVVRSNVARAKLTLNLGVAMGQAASYWQAGALIDYKYLAKALAYGKNANGKNRVIFYRADKALINQYTELLQIRNAGNPYTGMENATDIATMGVVDKVSNRIPHVTQWINIMDEATVGRLWTACAYQVQGDNSEFKNFDPQNATEEETDAFYTEVAKLFNQVVEFTQPNYTTLQRSEIQRSDNEVVKSFTMFMTQRLQNLSMFASAVNRVNAYSKELKLFEQYTKELQDAEDKYGKDSTQYKWAVENINSKYNGKFSGVTQEDVTKAKKQAGRVFGSIVLGTATLVGMKYLWQFMKHSFKNLMFGDDDDEFTLGNMAAQLGYNFGEALASNIPFGGDIFELIVGGAVTGKWYGIGSNGVENVTDIVGTISNLYLKFAQGKDIDMSEWRDTLLDALDFAGVPAQQAWGYVQAAIEWTEDIKHGKLGYNMGYDLTKPKGKITQSFDNFVIGEDNDVSDVIYDIRESKLRDVRVEQPGMSEEEQMKEAESRTKTAVTGAIKKDFWYAYETGDEEEKDRIIEYMKATGLYKQPMKTIKEWIDGYRKMLKDKSSDTLFDGDGNYKF